MSEVQVTVIGSSQPDERTAELAYRVGELLAESGATVVSGGRGGVMREVCRGVKENGGGLTVGILMGKTATDANEFLDVIIPTGLSEARNLPNVLAGQAVIAVGGAEGTLSEIAFAIKNGRPLFGVKTWEHPRFEFPADLTPEEAVKGALQAARQRSL